MRPSWIKANGRQDRSIRAFERRLNRTWKKPFELLGVQLFLARQLGAELNDSLHEGRGRKGNAVIAAVTRLHARACQIAAEVLVLLRAGYADGALTRWRSLHEVSVVLQFIRSRGAATAKRYLEHDAVESWKAAQEYSAHHARLNFEPITSTELAQVKLAFEKVIQKHGTNFRHSYGWAALDLKIKKPSFADIEKAAGFEHFRPFYRMASHPTHANPKGILFQIGMIDGVGTLPVGPTNYGLADAGQNTGLTLSQATAALITLAPTFDSLLAIEVMTELSSDIANAFVAAQLRIEARYRNLRKNRPS
jgi:hypothetical protein